MSMRIVWRCEMCGHCESDPAVLAKHLQVEHGIDLASAPWFASMFRAIDEQQEPRPGRKSGPG